MAGVPVARMRAASPRLLVAFNHRARYTVFQFHQRFGQQVVYRPADTVEHQRWRRRNGRGCACQTIILSSTPDFKLQHPPLTHTVRVGSGFAVAVMQIAFCGSTWGKVRRFNAGNIQRRASRWGSGALRNAECGCSSPSIYAVAFSANRKSHCHRLPSIFSP